MNVVHSVASRKLKRHGFTLIEVLLALGLTGLLLAAVTGALYQNYSLNIAGDRLIESTRNRFFFTQYLEQDACEATRGAERMRKYFDVDGPTPNSSSLIGERVLNLGTDYPLDPVTLYGESDFIAFGRMVAITPTASTNARVPPRDYQITLWTMTQRKALPLAYANQRTANYRKMIEIPKSSRIAGGEFFGQSTPAEIIRMNVSTFPNPHIIEESRFTEPVSQMRFRYLGPSGWKSQWNSEIQNSLPLMVEVTVSFTNGHSDLQYAWHFPQPAGEMFGGGT